MKQKWLDSAVFYEVYPTSFYDSNGDGIGDIPGIISKLDYLKDLGVDIVWISPIYPSPFADQGYDISDYYNIDPAFGTLEDMDRLIKEAEKRDMYILMDLVVNHCSDEHEWFQKACQDPDGEYGNQHHIAASRIVTKVCKETGQYDRLQYFGIYQWDLKDVKDIVTVDRKYLEIKQKMFRPYYRERNTIKKHQLMHPYEQWIKASDWNNAKRKFHK